MDAKLPDPPDSSCGEEADAGERSSVRQKRPRPVTAPVPLITVNRDEAAAALGVSVDSFDRHIRPQLPVIRLGRMVLFAVGELEQWAKAAGELALP